jgi:hypothetical protein
MAVVEIAKIQVRRGDARYTGMPQLDTGEFGWAISGTTPDLTAPELFVGNQLADGASVTANTRILTEHDLTNIFGTNITNSTYSYAGHRGAVTVYTGPGNSNISRTVKSKLDDLTTLADFGVPEGSSATTTTLGFQRAIDQLYLNSDKANPISRVELKIPAGTYEVTATIYIPPYATLIGDGKDKTTILFTAVGKPLFQFVDQTSTPGSPVTVLNFNSNTSPRNITIKGMTLKYSSSVNPNTASPLLRADGAIDSVIDDVKFKGDYLDAGTASYGDGTNTSHAAIEIQGTGALTSKNLRITNCVFDTISYGIKSNYDIEDTVIDNNKFENLYQGIVYGQSIAAGNQTGPKRSRITRNTFSIIARQAVNVGGTSTIYTNHVTSQNIFNNVGNGSSKVAPGTGDVGITTATSVMKFTTYGNVSNDDYFSRFEAINNTSTTSTFVIPIEGHASIIDNRIRTASLISTLASGVVVKLAHAGSITNIKLQYHYTAANGGISRWGNLYVVIAQGVVSDVTDDYKYSGTGDANLIFDAVLDGTPNGSGYPANTIRITYRGNYLTGQITYQINQYY